MTAKWKFKYSNDFFSLFVCRGVWSSKPLKFEARLSLVISGKSNLPNWCFSSSKFWDFFPRDPSVKCLANKQHKCCSNFYGKKNTKANASVLCNVFSVLSKERSWRWRTGTKIHSKWYFNNISISTWHKKFSFWFAASHSFANSVAP